MDRWIGIPLIATLSAFRRRSGTTVASLLAASPSRSAAAPTVVTLLKSAAIGDTVLLSAIVRELRTAWPNIRIQVACGSSNAALARMMEGVDAVIVLPMSKPLELWRMRKQLRSDVLIDFDSWPRINALIAYISGSTATLGFRTPNQYRHALFETAVSHSTLIHEAENYRRLIEPLVVAASNTSTGKLQPWLQIPKKRLGDEHTNSHASLIVFHMFAGGSQARFKEWPESNWIDLARALTARGYRIGLSGGPADAARNQGVAGLASGVGVQMSVLPIADLPVLAALLRDCAAVVSVDTGIAHLAGAAGACTLVLHGPTAPERWGALGQRVRYLKDNQTPWIQLGFEVTSSGEPVRLSVELVLESVLEVAALNLGGISQV